MGLNINNLKNTVLYALALTCDDDNSGTLENSELTIFENYIQNSNKETRNMYDTFKSRGYATNPDNDMKLADDKLSTKEGERNEFENVINSYETLDELITNLPKAGGALAADNYSTAKITAELLAREIKAMDIKSKADVESIKSKIEAKYDYGNTFGNGTFNDTILKLLIKIAEKEQIQKETKNIIDLYNEIRSDADNQGKNFTVLEALLKAKMNDKKYTGSYYEKEAYEAFTRYFNSEINSHNDLTLRNAYGETGRTTATTKKEVRNQVIANANGDERAISVIENDDIDNLLEARWNSYNERRNELKNATLTMFEDSFNTRFCQAMKSKFYNATTQKIDTDKLLELQEELRKLVGDDLNLNLSNETGYKEIIGVKKLMIALLRGKDVNEINMSESDIDKEITNHEVKKLIKFMGLKYGERDLDIKELTNRALTGAATGFVASGLTSNVKATQNVDVVCSVADANTIKNALGNMAEITSTDAGKAIVRITQIAEITFDIVKALAGAGIGALTNILLAILVNENPAFEPSCLNTEEVKDLISASETSEEAYNKIMEKFPGMKGAIISALVQKAATDNPNDWKNEFNTILNNIKGGNSHLNCEELQGAKFNPSLVEEEAPVEEAFSAMETITEVIPEETDVNVPTVDASKSSWTLITEMYDQDCFKQKYPKLKDRIRIMKLVQAINNGKYDQENIDRLLSESSNGVTYMKEHATELGIDGDIYESVINGGAIGTINVPDEIAGCSKVKERPDNAEKYTGDDWNGKVAGRVNATITEVSYSSQDATTWYLKLPGQTLQTFDNENAYNNAVNEYKGQNPNATIKDITVEEIQKK